MTSNKSKIFKIFSAITGGVLTTSLIIWNITVGFLNPPHPIIAVGSSSVLPLYSKYALTYDYDHKANERVDLIASAGGSGRGLSDISQNLTDIGNMSSREQKAITSNAGITKDWQENNVRTITVAQDAIGIVAKLPKDINFSEKDPKYKKTPPIKIDSLAQLYDKSSKLPTWSSLFDEKYVTINGSSAKKEVTPFGRDGGEAASGTSTAFFNGFKKYMGDKNPELNNLDVNHSESKVVKTQEANSAALNSLESSKKGGVTYLSLGYAEKVIRKGSSPNLKLLAIVGDKKSKANQKPQIPTSDNAYKGLYSWIRPFNSAFVIGKNQHQLVINYMVWMLQVSLDPSSIDKTNKENPFDNLNLPMTVPMTLDQYNKAHKDFVDSNCISLKTCMVQAQLKGLADKKSDFQLWNGSSDDKKIAFGLNLDDPW